MAEEHTQQPMPRGKSRRERVEYARSRDILDVASELNMELVRSGRDYRWKEHDSMVISTDKNMWNWFSRHQGGDVISLVETMKEVNFNQAIDYLNDGSFKEYTAVERVQEPFNYYLKPYEQPFKAARSYLKDQRGLSDETIDFFLKKGVLAQANAKVNGSIEPVVVFKSLDFSGEIVGATLQGIEENREKWPERGYAKNIVRNSDGITGLHVDIGQPNGLVFAESAIDLMSYYELHKDTLQDVRLVSMDGLKEGVVGRHLAQLQSELSGRPLRWSHDQLAEGLQTAIDNNFFADGKHADWITLAVDNDEAGRNFIDSLREKGASIVEDLPNLQPGQDKTDWNDVLKNRKPDQMETEEQGVLFENLADVTSSTAHTTVPELQVVFRSSDENILSEKYSSGEVIAYDIFVKDLYTENNKRLKATISAGEELPVFPIVTNSFADGTWFDLQDENGRTLVENFRYDIGAENETISERLDNILSSDYLEIAQQKDVVYPKPALPETVNQDSGILVHLYTGHQQFGTIDFNDLFNNSDLGSLADELGYGWAIDPKETFAIIHDETLTQTQINKIIDRMFDTGADDNDLKQYLQNPNFSLRNYAETGHTGLQEKAPEKTQEQITSEQHKKNETNIRDLSEQAQEAAPLPEATPSQPLKDLSPSQTESHSLLHFTIENPKRSIYKDNYHPIKTHELNKLNHHAPNIQSAAQWYLDNLSDITLHYFYQQGNKQYNINIEFEQYHFMHLTGLFPLKRGQTAVKTLHDFAEGRGTYDNLMIADNEAAFQKIKVLPDLKAIMETDAFYFDQVEDIPKLQSLSLEKAIKSDDKDVLLAFSSNEENIYPASLMELTKQLKIQTEQSQYQNVILGVYQERDGKFTQLSINEAYITDNGEEMLSILKDGQVSSDEPNHDLTPSQAEALIDAATFTKVLDTAYNVGNPAELGVEVPEEFQASWEQYNQLSEASLGDFKTIIAKADELGLLDKTTAFYQDWQQDQIYNDTYHVRLRSSNEGPNSPQLPFEPTHLVSYQDFVTELYEANQNVSRTKPIAFDIYAPGGILIKEGVRYAIGDETQPVSRLLGLGYRRLEDYPNLAAIDEKVLSQLENQEVNQSIATEANEQTVVSQEIPQERDSREDFQSPKQSIRTGLAQRVEEIDAFLTNNSGQELSQRTQESISAAEPFDYKTASAYDISERAFQKIREYTQSPEDLMEYMEFMSKFPHLSPRNVALIQDQWKGANAVATYDQWQSMGEALGIKPEDVIQTKATYVNKRTGETKEVVHQGLSVKTGEKSQITLFRPLMVRMIPVIDETGNHVKNDKGNPKYKKFSDATPQEKELVKEGKLPVRQFQERDSKTGQPRFTTYKVFELSQTTLKPESYPKAMPNRHYNFNTNKVRTKEVLEGLCDYAESIGVSIMKDEAHVLGNAKGAFFPEEQLILINPDNTPGEKIATTIHELAHATLHNPKLADQYQELPKGQKEFEAEMTSHLLSKYFGLDTSEKAIDYMASWTDHLKALDDKQLTDSLKRVHQTVSKMHKQIENHTKPYSLGKNRGQAPNFPKAPTKGPSR